MSAVFACDPPLTPDEGEAQSWLSEELARSVYNTDSSGFKRLLQSAFTKLANAFTWHEVDTPPMSLILVILAIIIIAAILIAVILNPIRLRIRASHSVFEVEATEEDIRRCFDEAVAAEDWNLAYVWAYRLMVVGLDECEVVSATPGLTAREAAVAATRVVPDQGTALDHHARTFDRVRYGHSSVAEQDVNALRELTPILLAQCRKAQDHA